MSANVMFYKNKKDVDRESIDKKTVFDNLDKEICQLLGHEYDEKKWCSLTKERVEGIDWYNIVGMMLACGRTCQEIRDIVRQGEHAENEVNTNIIKVCDYIEANYDIDCWRGW